MNDISVNTNDSAPTDIVEAIANHRPIRPLLIDPRLLKYTTVQDFTPEVRMVNPSILWVDDQYQRNPSEKSTKLIKKIVAEWAWEHFKPPIVTEYDHKLFVVDGQHTSIAAVTHPDINQIPVFVVPIANVKDAAKAFIAHNTNRTTVTPIQLFKAQLEAGDDEAISINMALQRSGVKLVPNANFNGQERALSCLGTLKDILGRYGVRALRITLDICVAARLTPIQSQYVTAVSDLMFGKKYREDGYDAQAIALTIRDYPYDQLTADIELKARRESKTKSLVATELIQSKYIKTFGKPSLDESKSDTTNQNS